MTSFLEVLEEIMTSMLPSRFHLVFRFRFSKPLTPQVRSQGLQGGKGMLRKVLLVLFGSLAVVAVVAPKLVVSPQVVLVASDDPKGGMGTGG